MTRPAMASVTALDALRRVERALAQATVETGPSVLLDVVREIRGLDSLTVEVARAGTVERLTALGIAAAEQTTDAVFIRYRIIATDDRALGRRWWQQA